MIEVPVAEEGFVLAVAAKTKNRTPRSLFAAKIEVPAPCLVNQRHPLSLADVPDGELSREPSPRAVAWL
jgi:hypothetical protein